MTSLRTLLLAAAVATGCAAPSDGMDDLDLAADDTLVAAPFDGKADAPGWETAPTLHAGGERYDAAGRNSRRVHALWVQGTKASPVPLTISVAGQNGDSVRVAVLGPLKKDGTRETLAAAGYSRPVTTATVKVRFTSSGQHLVVVGSYNLLTATAYTVATRCDAACAPSRVDALASPKDGALVGSAQGGRLLKMTVGAALAGRGDVKVEVWHSSPMQGWNAKKLGTSVASGTQVNMILPASVKPGDDLRLVVRDGAGAVLDTDLGVRWAPAPGSFARLDAILYGDLVSVDVAGVAGYFEGVAALTLRSETRDLDIDTVALHADRPGQVTNGFAAFDASFNPELFGEDGELNPALPRNGELLSVGEINGNGDFVRMGCFEYCNDLSGMETCTGGPRPCP